MSQINQFEKDPEECNHPEEQIEDIFNVGSGLRPRCSVCGYYFMIISSHKRVITHGEYLTDATFECRNCGKTATSIGNLSMKMCIIPDI